MTLRLRCMRCGDWAEMDPRGPYEHGLCLGCFCKWVATGIGSRPFFRFAQRFQKHQERHPTFKALTAAIDALESTPHGTLVEAE